MKFLMAIYGNEEKWASFEPEYFAGIIARTDAHNASLKESGELLGAFGVADQAQATRVRFEGGSRVVTDGPYIETKEYLGSIYLVDCDSVERAHEIAAAMPSAEFTDIEIRPLMHGDAED
jgi:hypothetical protein